MTGGASAGFGRRFAAMIYDAFLLAALLMTYTGVILIFTRRAILPETYGPWVYLYRAGLIAVIAAYYVLNWIRSGQTLGMRAWRLRVVNDAGLRPDARSALLRFVCGFLAWPPAALGVLWLYLDPDHLAIHDRLSRTRVTRVSSARAQPPPALTSSRDGDQGAESDDGRRQPADDRRIDAEQLAALLHHPGNQEENDSEQHSDDGAGTGAGRA